MSSLQEWVNGWTRDGRDLTHDPRRAVYVSRHPELTEQYGPPPPIKVETPAKSVHLPPPNPQKQVPLTILQRAISVATVGAATAARALATGHAFVSEDVILERLALCRACDQFDQVKESCKLCGCGCNGSEKLANKLAHASSVCPYSPPKWGPVT